MENKQAMYILFLKNKTVPRFQAKAISNNNKSHLTSHTRPDKLLSG
jgi:hypothetical protein